MKNASLTLHPIGTIATPYSSKYAAPRQPATARTKSIGVITLNPKANFEQAVEDLDGFEFVWILYWFDRNTSWKPKVLPPTEERIKRGVFATRSPHRPNPIGLSLCRLIDVRGRTIRIEDPDMLDGTPILDIKPYLPHAEAYPDARAGWISASHERASGQYRVTFDAAVRSKLNELPDTEREEVLLYLSSVLSRDPFPHDYRRIRLQADGLSVIAVKRWRFAFTVTATTVRVTSMYREREKTAQKVARRGGQKR